MQSKTAMKFVECVARILLCKCREFVGKSATIPEI